jgi:hypothetical protein
MRVWVLQRFDSWLFCDSGAGSGCAAREIVEVLSSPAVIENILKKVDQKSVMNRGCIVR